MLQLTDQEFTFIVDLMKSTYGVNLIKKRQLIEGRLSNYVNKAGYASYMDYFKYVQSNPDELILIINMLTTNHTFFWRENEHFRYYQSTVLPWIDNELKTKDLRVWSAACSSGQEPYTLSLITQEYLGERTTAWESTILASDISNKVLARAKEGIYTMEDIAKMPNAWVNKYFRRIDNEHMQIVDSVRKRVAFRYFNLLDPFNFKKPFQTIFCRNVMIYFDTPTKNAVIEKMYQNLLPGGYFFIGQSESLSGCTHKFKYVQPSIYRKE